MLSEYAMSTKEEKPDMKKKGKLFSRVFFGILAAVMLLCCAAMVMDALDSRGTNPDPNDATYFDAVTDDGSQQVLAFNLLSDSFASFTVGEGHNYYFALDSNEYGIFPYIVCMSDQQFAQYTAICDFTYSDEDWDQSPGYGSLYGYPMPIDSELQELAIEFFNYFWDEDILTPENFSEYIGEYYLDATYQPGSHTALVESLILIPVFLVLAGLMLFLAFRREKPAAEPAEETAAVQPLSADAYPISASPADTPAGELPPEIRFGSGSAGALVGALLGMVVWVLLYRVGYISGIAGFLTVFLALKGFEKLGGGMNRAGVILSCLLSLLAILAGNVVGVSWVIADVFSETNPGRATLSYVLRNFPQLMSYLDLWGTFLRDLLIGLFLGILAGIGPISATLKANQEETIPR